MESFKKIIEFNVIPRNKMNFTELKIQKIEMKSPLDKAAINIDSKFLAKLDLAFDLINISQVFFHIQIHKIFFSHVLYLYNEMMKLFQYFLRKKIILNFNAGSN